MLILGDIAHTYLKICLNEDLSKIGHGSIMWIAVAEFLTTAMTNL